MKETLASSASSRESSESTASCPPLPGWLRNGHLIRTVGLIMTVGLLGNMSYIALQTTWSAGEIMASLHPQYLLLAVVMVVIPLVTHATRIVMWSRVFRCRVSFGRAFTAVMFNEIGSAVTPTAVGGGYAKLYFLYRSGFSTAQATLTMILGSVEDMVFVISIVATAVYLGSADNPSLGEAVDQMIGKAPYLVLLLSLVVFSYVGLRILRRRKPNCCAGDPAPGEKKPMIERLRAFRDDFLTAVAFAAKHGRGTLLLNTVLSLIGWICRYGSINAIMAGFGLPVDPLLFPVLNWSVFTVNNFVATPGGMGGAEAAFILVMAGFIPGGLRSVVTLAWRFATFYLGVLVASSAIAANGSGLQTSLENRTEEQTSYPPTPSKTLKYVTESE